MKFIKINISRTQSSELFLEVSDNFDLSLVSQWRPHILEDIIEQQLHDDFDWSSNFDYSVIATKFVSEDEATEYRYNSIDLNGIVQDSDPFEDD